MEVYTIPQNITAIYVQAASFPQGVKAAHEALRAKLQNRPGRFFGISWPGENGSINYKAAAEELFAGEAAAVGLQTFIIRKGNYISEVLINWMKQEGKIAETFQRLLQYPSLAKDGYCLEEYINGTDIRLMVTLA